MACADQDAEQILQAVLDGGESAARGDMIFVSDVSRAVCIGDGASGEEMFARSI